MPISADKVARIFVLSEGDVGSLGSGVFPGNDVISLADFKLGVGGDVVVSEELKWENPGPTPRSIQIPFFRSFLWAWARVSPATQVPLLWRYFYRARVNHGLSCEPVEPVILEGSPQPS